MGGEEGMMTFDKEAKRLLDSGVITEETYTETLGIIRLMDDK